ncbi:MAG: hypothetical protein ACE5JI_11130, partial [Acidobacteriota bacterium]
MDWRPVLLSQEARTEARILLLFLSCVKSRAKSMCRAFHLLLQSARAPALSTQQAKVWHRDNMDNMTVMEKSAVLEFLERQSQE